MFLVGIYGNMENCTVVLINRGDASKEIGQNGAGKWGWA